MNILNYINFLQSAPKNLSAFSSGTIREASKNRILDTNKQSKDTGQNFDITLENTINSFDLPIKLVGHSLLEEFYYLRYRYDTYDQQATAIVLGEFLQENKDNFQDGVSLLLNAVSKIDLVIEESLLTGEEQKNYNNLEQDNIQNKIYSHNFAVHSQNDVIFVKEILNQDNQIAIISSFSPKVYKEAKLLWPIGGYFPRDLNLNNCCPLYTSIDYKRISTALEIFTQNYLYNVKINHMQEGGIINNINHVFVYDHYLQPVRTLAEKIKQGKIVVTNKNKVKFQSQDYKVHDFNNSIIKIKFKRQQ